MIVPESNPIDQPVRQPDLGRATVAFAPALAEHAVVLDETKIAELEGEHGPETTDEIVCLFALELDQRIASLAAATGTTIAARDVHALASSARSVGCFELACLCQETEQAVRGGKTSLTPHLPNLLQAADRARRAIADMRLLRVARRDRSAVDGPQLSADGTIV